MTDNTGWISMWLIAFGIFFVCKWITWRRACSVQGVQIPGTWRSLSFFIAWPGMDARAFLSRQAASRRSTDGIGMLVLATAKVCFGGLLIWITANHRFNLAPLLEGWIGMFGLLLVLHFGLFELLALFWQRAGVEAEPVMRHPLYSTSLAEFWGKRWNTAFNVLAQNLAFRPLARRCGTPRATLGVFLLSGLVHELVISVPARGGFGLPTGYFFLQGIGVLMERSRWGRRLGLGCGARGWCFVVICTAGPAYWLFHPAFVRNVILPMLAALNLK